MIKIGSGVLAPGGRLRPQILDRVCDELVTVTGMGYAPVLVSSGAIACGYGAMGLGAMPRALHEAQAAAAIGQPILMHAYQQACAQRGRVIAQVLLTADDLGDRRRYLNALRTLETLIGAGVIPIINENDSVLFDEIRVGDNDTLAALLGSALRAQHAVLVSVAGGVQRADGGGVIPSMSHANEARAHVEDDTSATGTGGMGSKLSAVATLLGHGVETAIIPGPSDALPDPISRSLRGERIGTRFTLDDLPAIPPARKSWLAQGGRAKGRVLVDAGAARALRDRGASLLPKGVVRVEGDFAHRQPIEICDERGAPIARGVSCYNAREIAQIMGMGSERIEPILGYRVRDEIVHRDDMVVLDSNSTPSGSGPS